MYSGCTETHFGTLFRTLFVWNNVFGFMPIFLIPTRRECSSLGQVLSVHVCQYTEDDSHANDDSMSLQKGCLRNPVDSYVARNVSHVGQGKGQGRLLHYPSFASDAQPVLDVAYASQLELFTRVFLGDVYSGLLRGGSVVCHAYSYFIGPRFSSFLDAKSAPIVALSGPRQGLLAL
jgi:hypothetical protein